MLKTKTLQKNHQNGGVNLLAHYCDLIGWKNINVAIGFFIGLAN